MFISSRILVFKTFQIESILTLDIDSTLIRKKAVQGHRASSLIFLLYIFIHFNLYIIHCIYVILAHIFFLKCSFADIPKLAKANLRNEPQNVFLCSFGIGKSNEDENMHKIDFCVTRTDTDTLNSRMIFQCINTSLFSSFIYEHLLLGCIVTTKSICAKRGFF